MTVQIDSDSANIAAVRFTEQGSNPANPTAGGWKLYFKASGLYYLSTGGTVTQVLGDPTTTEGDLLYRHTGAITRLAIGASGYVLASNGTDPGWAAPTSTFTGVVTGTAFSSTGLTGAVQGMRIVGATVSGSPGSGTFIIGDCILDLTGALFWVCTAAGSPGTWAQAIGTSLSNPMTTRGDIIVEAAGPTPARLAIGAANSVLKSNGTDPSWTTAPTLAGILTAQALVASGLTGATAASRYVGSTASGAPASGTFAVGDFIIDQTGVVYVCTVAGTPGTWSTASGFSDPMTTEGDLIYYHSGVAARLPVGGIGSVLVSNGTDPSWSINPTLLGNVTAHSFTPFGLTGTTVSVRWVGGVTTAPPASGTFLLGDAVIDTDGFLWVCTVAGSPGTWVLSGFHNPMTTAGDLILGDTAGAPIRIAKGTDAYVLTMSASTHLPVWAAAAFINPMTTQDDIMVGGASGVPARLAKGSDGQVLTVNASTHHLDWETPSSGFANPMTTRGDIITEQAGPVAGRLALGAAGQRLKSDGTDVGWGDDIIDINFVIDGGGATITTGMKGYIESNQALTIVANSLLGDQSGSIVVNIWKCTYAQFDAGSTHPVATDKITSSTPPTISTATKSTDSTLSSWTTSISASDILAFNVDSVTTMQRVTLNLKCKKAA